MAAPRATPELEDLLGTIDLLNRNERDSNGAECRGVSAVAVQQSRRIDTESDPGGERRENDSIALGKKPDDGDRCHDANHGRDQPEAGFFHALATSGEGQNSNRERRRGRRLEFEPEARIERRDKGHPDSDARTPRKPRKVLRR